MGFGQNVLRMTWKERFVQFSCKAHCFPVSKTISGHCDDFENFNAQNCELGKTCCAWPEKSVLYNFQGKRTAFRFRREFQASVTILRTFTLKIAIWPKRAAHDLKRAFCTFFIKRARFSLFGENFRPVWRFWELWRPKCDLDKTCCAWPEKSVLYNFYKKRTVFPFWTSLRPVSRFWELWRSQMGFGQNVLRMTWKERFVQFSWKAHCFPVLNRISGQFHDFENLDARKCDLAKTYSAWPETSVLYSFHRKRTVFPFWREFQASVTILKTLTLKNAIWPKRAAHDLKTAFCTIFMESALFCRFEENLRPVLRFWELWRTKMRFGQIVLRMTWKERFVQFSWKAHSSPVLKRIWGQCDDFENFHAQKSYLAKTCCAWHEKSVLYNFHGKRTAFPFRREFQASVTILRTFVLKNAIWSKRAAHDLKRAFCTIFIKSARFSLFGENFRPVWRFWELWRPKCDLDKTCCPWPEKSVLYNFYKKRTVFPFWREFQASVTILRTLTPKMRFGQNVLRMTWKERFVQFL